MANNNKIFTKSADCSESEFIDAIKKVDKAQSVTGIIYSQITVTNGCILGIRESSQAPFSISITKLYQAYQEVKEFNTTTLKPYVNRVQSPAMAVLIASNLVSPIENAIHTLRGKDASKIKNNITQTKSSPKKILDIKKSTIGYIVGVIFTVCLFAYIDKKGSALIDNGELQQAAKIEAATKIKQKLKNPSSYKGYGWVQGDWDSNSDTERYFLLHSFSATNEYGYTEDMSATVIFDKDGHITRVVL